MSTLSGHYLQCGSYYRPNSYTMFPTKLKFGFNLPYGTQQERNGSIIKDVRAFTQKWENSLSQNIRNPSCWLLPQFPTEAGGPLPDSKLVSNLREREHRERNTSFQSAGVTYANRRFTPGIGLGEQLILLSQVPLTIHAPCGGRSHPPGIGHLGKLSATAHCKIYRANNKKPSNGPGRETP